MVIITSDEILQKSQIFASCSICQAPSESIYPPTTMTHKALKLQKSTVSYYLRMCVNM